MWSKFVSWLKSFFSTKEEWDVYRPSEKLVYKYHDGQKWVKADPLDIWQKVMDVGPLLDTSYKLYRSPSKDAPKGLADLVSYIRKIFDVKPVSEGGLTLTQTVGLLDHFLTYTGMLKKSGSESAMAAQVSQTSQPSLATSQTTTSSADTGSTREGSVKDSQLPSPTESESLSASSNPTSPSST